MRPDADMQQQASNYLDIKPLLDVGCKTVANMIKGKSPEEIRKTFNITNDFTLRKRSRSAVRTSGPRTVKRLATEQSREGRRGISSPRCPDGLPSFFRVAATQT